MKESIFEALIEENGMISIPVDVLNDMGLKIGDELVISYSYPSESIERCMRIESSYHEEDEDTGYLCIPDATLKQCNMADKNLHMICFDEEITITTEDKLCEFIPEVLLQVFEKHGISKEEIAIGIAEANDTDKIE